MTVEEPSYRIGRQRIVQTYKHDHAIQPDDERTLCGKYGARAVVIQRDLTFSPFADHACEDCSRLVAT